MPMLLKTMTSTACPSYDTLIALWIMLIGLGDSSGGLIMFGSLYLTRRVMKRRTRRRVMKRRNNLAMKKTIWVVWSRIMNMRYWVQSQDKKEFQYGIFWAKVSYKKPPS